MTPKGQVVFSDVFCTLGKDIGKKDTTVSIWDIDKYKTEIMIEEEERRSFVSFTLQLLYNQRNTVLYFYTEKSVYCRICVTWLVA